MTNSKLAKLKLKLGIASIAMSQIIFPFAFFLLFKPNFDYDIQPFSTMVTDGSYDLFMMFTNPTEAVILATALALLGGILIFVGGVATLASYKSKDKAVSICIAVTSCIMQLIFTAFTFKISSLLEGSHLWIFLGLCSLILAGFFMLFIIQLVRNNFPLEHMEEIDD